MAVRNIAMFDSNKEEAEDFITGLEQSTGLHWEAIVCTANEGRKNKLANLIRYFKYFIFPLEWLISHKEEVEKYKESAAEFICQKYNWDDVVEKTVTLYGK